MQETVNIQETNGRSVTEALPDQRRDGEGMTEFTIRRITNEIIERCAAAAEDFGWTIPMYAPEAEVNAATDEVACMVTQQVANAIRELKQ